MIPDCAGLYGWMGYPLVGEVAAADFHSRFETPSQSALLVGATSYRGCEWNDGNSPHLFVGVAALTPTQETTLRAELAAGGFKASAGTSSGVAWDIYSHKDATKIPVVHDFGGGVWIVISMSSSSPLADSSLSSEGIRAALRAANPTLGL